MELCCTVEIAHKEQILHRDLKPANIIVKDLDSAKVVIVDYGLSFGPENPDLTETDETFRNELMELPETNTPGGDRRNPISDLTAICATFYYMLSVMLLVSHSTVMGGCHTGDLAIP